MRSLIISTTAALLVTASAWAGPGEDFSEFAGELRSQATQRAQLAATTPAAPAQPLDIEDPFYFELEQFAVDAMRLSVAVAQANGPEDLQCIFRGISNDASERLEALNMAESAGEQARIYRTIADLLRDAQEIVPSLEEEGIELDD